jgi:hypothetical protein
MAGRIAALAALLVLAGCANVESVGRNARGGAATPAPQTTPAPAPRPAPQPSPAVTLPAPQPQAAAPTTPAPRAPLTTPPAAVSSPAPQPTAAPRVAAPAPTPAPAPQPPTPRAEAPPVASQVSVPTPTPPPSRPRSDDEDIVVPGQAQEQVIAPDGDFRSRVERMEDIRSWDRCITSVQAVYERDPMRPQLTSPEDYCAQSLGMSDRNSIPDSRMDRHLRRQR